MHARCRGPDAAATGLCLERGCDRVIVRVFLVHAKGFACCRCLQAGAWPGFLFVCSHPGCSSSTCAGRSSAACKQLCLVWETIVRACWEACSLMYTYVLACMRALMHACMQALGPACSQGRLSVCQNGREWQQGAQCCEFARACCVAACAPVSIGCMRRACHMFVCATARDVWVLGRWLVAHTHRVRPLHCCLGPKQHAWPRQQQWLGLVRHTRAVSVQGVSV